MQQITQYVTIQERSKKDLDAAVNQAIQNGWQPLGGVSVAMFNGLVYYMQALVAYKQ